MNKEAYYRIYSNSWCDVVDTGCKDLGEIPIGAIETARDGHGREFVGFRYVDVPGIMADECQVIRTESKMWMDDKGLLWKENPCNDSAKTEMYMDESGGLHTAPGQLKPVKATHACFWVIENE